MEFIYYLVIAFIALVVGYGFRILLQEWQGNRQRHALETELNTRQMEAEVEAREIIQKGDARAKKTRDEAERKAERVRRDLEREDDRLRHRREDLDQRFERLENRDRRLNQRQSRLDKREAMIAEMEEQRQEELQVVANMTFEEAREQVLAQAEDGARGEVATILRRVEADTRVEADRRARDIISLAIQRLASEHVSSVAVHVIPLPSDDMKGRIIGRNGRNIRAFELATGVDVIVDDTPDAVTVSQF